MSRRLLLVAAIVLALAAPAAAQQTTNVTATDTSTGARTQVGDNTNHAIRTNCVSGCSGGTTDTDDGTVAGGQSTGITIALGQVWDGSNWKRLTIGTAGTAAAQVLTVQGIASMTPFLVTPSLPALAATSTKQSDGTQKTQIVDGSGNVIAATSNNLNVQCANCSGSGVSAVDEASVTEGTSVFAPAGGYYKASLTALTTGQQGMVALTPSRSFHIALYDPSGNALTNTSNALDVNIKSGGSTTVTEAATITANQASSALTSAVVYGFDGTTDSRLRTRAAIIGSADVGLVTRPFLPSDGTNTTPAMDAVGRAGFHKLTDGTNTYADPCAFLAPTTVAISQATATVTQYIAAASSKKNYICGLVLVAGAAEIINLLEGTGANCGTATAAVVGSTTAANGMSFAANGGLVNPIKIPGIGTNVNTCLATSGANRVAGYLTYVQQ